MTLIFDLDKTLYPSNNGLFKKVDERINEYLVKYIKIPENSVNKIRYNYWLKYGTTLNGLMKFYNINPIHYLDFVHDVDIDKFLKEDEELKDILKAIPVKKYVLTNGYLPFAKKVLEKIGIREYIEDVFDIVWLDFIPKPYFYGYRKIIKTLKVNPENSVFFDDFYLNLFPAKHLKMTTVLVNNGRENFYFVDCKISDIKKLKNLKFIIDF